MFAWGRELKRLFEADVAPRDGLTGGDVSLLEVLDIELLRSEARAADIAAGRISAKDPHQRRLEAARVWRELARRSGDAAALRNAVLAAEKAAQGFKAAHRTKAWAAARLEQAMSAILGADLYGDPDLERLAQQALHDAAAAGGAVAALAAGQLAGLAARRATAQIDYAAACSMASDFEQAIGALGAHLRSKIVTKTMVADLSCERAALLISAGARLKDARLHEHAIDDLDRLSGQLDLAYEPLIWARVQSLRAAARVGFGQICGLVEDIAEGVEILAGVLEALTPDHSPLDWARLQMTLAWALQILGETSETDRAFSHAMSCYEHALWATRRQPALVLRAQLAQARAACLARRAELAADPGMLDQAIADLRADLARRSANRDPVGWAIAQLDLAQIYIARLKLCRQDADRAAAGMALTTAIEVLDEHGLTSLAGSASQMLERLGEG